MAPDSLLYASKSLSEYSERTQTEFQMGLSGFGWPLRGVKQALKVQKAQKGSQRPQTAY